MDMHIYHTPNELFYTKVISILAQKNYKIKANAYNHTYNNYSHIYQTARHDLAKGKKNDHTGKINNNV